MGNIRRGLKVGSDVPHKLRIRPRKLPKLEVESRQKPPTSQTLKKVGEEKTSEWQVNAGPLGSYKKGKKEIYKVEKPDENSPE
jgi:hypothetical protein